jgi:hypothetical protein
LAMANACSMDVNCMGYAPSTMVACKTTSPSIPI